MRVAQNPAVLLAILVLSAMMMIFNETTVAVALPAIMAEFGVSADVAQWLLTGFLLTMAVVIPTSGFLIDRLTTRTLYFLSMALFLAGSVIAALAPAFWVLIAARVIQAAGTAVMIPLLFTVTLNVVSPQRRGTVMGLNAVVISVAPALGPTLAGLVLSRWTWHHIFWVMVPLPALLLALAIVVMPNVGEVRKTPLDALSVLLSVFAFGGLVYGLSTFTQLVTGESVAPGIAVGVGVVVTAIFAARQRRLAKVDKALLNLNALRYRDFTLSLVAIVVVFGSFLGTVNLLPMYLQGALGLSTVVTGLILLPGGVAQGIASPIAGRIFDAVGTRPIAIPGAILLAAAQVTLWLTLGEDTPQWLIVVTLILTNIAMAMVMTPLMTASLSALPQPLYSHGSAILNTLQQLGGAAGTAVFIGIMSLGVAGGASQAEAAPVSFVAGIVASIIALAAVSFVGGKRKTVTVESSAPR
ncbi:DHA2 family efflux MFS transporter permease subunit [Corynebacterium imitans]|uniref:DHA2 family efflux MFS transporter permease subunit n=1 Tax=Corynebacterium imitans TaxID=156978 RepID=UPI00254A02BA|nr:DHA2 family efflux MFS transporter permease subunit [Corynebacterium imitans]MDK8307203.1 DHA2 family efflux MFS transporter permease subunit [Corynebacterium imitans]MDK8638427.1 DHA2 family efflux MFS transporter permease subunit [Corynebacterium imitans]MDK8773621.1 DHA2 family efflux MFS transporter permease subunit [Corynebacterium imitans]